jgi:hypothetical protein
LCVVVLALTACACSLHDQQLRQHQQAFESLGATTQALGVGWLSGHLSGTFTQTALEQTFRLVEQERTALGASPEMLIDARGARLSDTAEGMSRVIAAMLRDVRAADAARARADLAAIPIQPAGAE